MNIKTLDTIVLEEDLPAYGLKRGDIGAVVESYSQDTFEVEFVTASGRTQALLPLHLNQIRPKYHGDRSVPMIFLPFVS